MNVDVYNKWLVKAAQNLQSINTSIHLASIQPENPPMNTEQHYKALDLALGFLLEAANSLDEACKELSKTKFTYTNNSLFVSVDNTKE